MSEISQFNWPPPGSVLVLPILLTTSQSVGTRVSAEADRHSDWPNCSDSLPSALGGRSIYKSPKSA